MALTEHGFWLCLGLIIYVYAGYPVLVCVLAAIFGREIRKAEFEPSITVVIAAFNEAREIRDTVTNKLDQNYPRDRLNVIVVSDGSTDGTDEIIRGLSEMDPGRVRLLRQEPRQGKTQALNLALRHVSTDLVVFSDANSIYAPGALRALSRAFADASVGYVTGQLVYSNPTESGISEGSGVYMSYENMLRAAETKLGSVVGVDGGLDAVRRELYMPMRPDQLPDFVLPLSVVERNKRVVYEPDAVVCEPGLADSGAEFRMRVRVSLRSLWALYDKRALLNPLRYPVFAWQLISQGVPNRSTTRPKRGDQKVS